MISKQLMKSCEEEIKGEQSKGESEFQNMMQQNKMREKFGSVGHN